MQNGQTALMMSVQGNNGRPAIENLESARLLIEGGAALHVEDKVCHSPIIPILFYEFYFLNRMVRLL